MDSGLVSDGVYELIIRKCLKLGRIGIVVGACFLIFLAENNPESISLMNLLDNLFLGNALPLAGFFCAFKTG